MSLFAKKNVLIAFVALLTIVLLMSGCKSDATIEMIPVFPSDEQNLLEEAEWETLWVDAVPFGEISDESIVSTVLAKGDRLRISGLSAGWWSLRFRAKSLDGVEILRGDTYPFKVAPGNSLKVKFFMGRSSAFNLITLQPADLASEIAGLSGLSATAVNLSKDTHKIIVAGGVDTVAHVASRDLFSINPETFEIEKLTSKLTCPRFGHTAMLVNTSKGQRIVFAGGEKNCEPGLDVLNPATGEVNFLKVGCFLDSTEGAVAEVKFVRDGATVTTGNIIIPGHQACVMDCLGDMKPTGVKLAAELQSPVKSAVSGTGDLLMIDATGKIMVDSARAGALGVCSGHERSVLKGLDTRKQARLLPMKQGNHFLLIGGEAQSFEKTASDWSFISVDNCHVERIQEGTFDSGGPRDGFAPLDIGFDDETGSESLLLTGGQGASVGNTVSLFYKAQFNDVSFPLTFDSSSVNVGFQMRNVRIGHDFVSMPNGAVWALGGGINPAEIFLSGDKGKFAFGINHTKFDYRKPSLLSVTVYDSNSMVDLTDISKFTMDINNFMFSRVQGTKNVPKNRQISAVISRVATANRGISAAELGLSVGDVVGGLGCDNIAIEDETAFESTALGDLDGESIIGIDPSDDFNAAVSKVINDASNLGDVAVYMAPGSPAVSNSSPIAQPIQISSECGWRQPVRVGFDGLGFSQKDGTYAGIKLLIWITDNDDCSQGVYDEKTQKPSEAVMANNICTENLDEWNNYFQIPPQLGTIWASQFKEKLKELIWNPRDLLVLMISGRNIDEHACDDDFKPPRRLSMMAQSLKSEGAQIQSLEVCGRISNDDVSDARAWLEDSIIKRNPLLACVPSAIDTTPYRPVEYSEFGPAGKGLWEVMHHDATLLSNLSARIDKTCKVLRVFDVDSGDQKNVRHTRISRVDSGDGGWKLATDADKRAGCNDGLVVSMEQSNDNLSVSDTAYIVCLNP